MYSTDLLAFLVVAELRREDLLKQQVSSSASTQSRGAACEQQLDWP